MQVCARGCMRLFEPHPPPSSPLMSPRQINLSNSQPPPPPPPPLLRPYLFHASAFPLRSPPLCPPRWCLWPTSARDPPLTQPSAAAAVVPSLCWGVPFSTAFCHMQYFGLCVTNVVRDACAAYRLYMWLEGLGVSLLTRACAMYLLCCCGSTVSHRVFSLHIGRM